MSGVAGPAEAGPGEAGPGEAGPGEAGPGEAGPAEAVVGPLVAVPARNIIDTGEPAMECCIPPREIVRGDDGG